MTIDKEMYKCPKCDRLITYNERAVGQFNRGCPVCGTHYCDYVPFTLDRDDSISKDVQIKTFKSMNKFRKYFFPNWKEYPKSESKQIIVIIPRPSVR